MNPQNKIKAGIIEYFNSLMERPTQNDFDDGKYEALQSVFTYCRHLVETYDCEINHYILNQRISQAAVEVLFHGEWGFGDEEKNNFVGIVSMCDGINIAANPCGEGWMQVTFFIENIWKNG